MAQGVECCGRVPDAVDAHDHPDALLDLGIVRPLHPKYIEHREGKQNHEPSPQDVVRCRGQKDGPHPSRAIPFHGPSPPATLFSASRSAAALCTVWKWMSTVSSTSFA